MRIAAVDCSGLVASVAVLDEGMLIAEYTVNYKKTHSQTILPMLEEILRMTEINVKDIDAIAVAAGPGSFTGLRIGSATVKGLALALDVPVIPVPTLEALAFNLCGAGSLVCPIMDARRDQVYTGVYSFCGNGTDIEMKEEISGRAVSVTELAGIINNLGKEVIFLGDGVPVYRDRLDTMLEIGHFYAPAHMNLQSSASVATLGEKYYKKGIYESALTHRPVYFRVSQAERERNDAVVIDIMREEDLEEVAKLEEENFSMPWKVDDFRELIDNKDTVYIVARDRGHICGTSGIRNISGEGEITNVVVREEYRESGLGTKLIERLLDEGRKLGCNAFTLEVRVSNAAAIALYKKFGFVSEGVRPGFYEKPVEDAYIMWKRD